jgi:mono/diheme cytochrome c family protein
MGLLIRAVGTAAAVATIAVVGPVVSAGTYEHARQTGKRCSTCHTSKAPHVTNLNAAGQYFLQHRTLEGFTPPPAGQRNADKPQASPAAELRPGLAVYNRACVLCHGPGGKGTALAMPLTGERKHARTEALAVEVITGGIDGTAMMAFKGVLSEREIHDVARYVMTLRSPDGAR